MYMIDPKYMCLEHLCDEHGFIHMIQRRLSKGFRLVNFVAFSSTVEPKRLRERHDQLAAEIVRRGYSHNSPLEEPHTKDLKPYEYNARVNKYLSVEQLMKCDKCRKLIGDSKEILSRKEERTWSSGKKENLKPGLPSV